MIKPREAEIVSTWADKLDEISTMFAEGVYDAGKNYRTAGESTSKKQTSVKQARFSPEDIDNINSGLYNYKWVSDESVLSGAELNDLFSKVASMRHGVKFRKMPDGTYAITIGINNTVLRKLFIDSRGKGATNENSVKDFENIYGERVFTQYVPQAVRDLQELEKSRKNSRSYVFDDNESEDGAGVSRNAENVGEIK